MHTDSIQWLLEVDKKDINFIVGVFESYDDFGVVRTLDEKRGLIEVLLSPDYVEEARKLLASLAGEISMRVLKSPGVNEV